MFQLFQAGSGDRRTLILIHYLDAHGALGDKIRGAAPEACILIDTQMVVRPDKTVDGSRYTRLGSGGADGILPLAAAKALAQKLAGPFEIAQTIGAGFSAGGQGVKTWLDAGQIPDAVVICDGWHASTVPGPMISRRAYVARALLGEAALVLSHTLIQPPTYLSTRKTAELLTGWVLDEKGGVDDPVVHADTGLHVESHPGATGPDHIHQAQEVFPRLLTRALELLDELGEANAARPADEDCELDELALRLCLREMRDGVHEVPDGSNTGPRLRPYFTGVARGNGVKKTLLHILAMLWCSAANGWAWWTAWARLGGETMPPHDWRASVAEDVADARETGRYRPRGSGYAVRRGDDLIFGRAGQWPSKGGSGHIAKALEAPDGRGRYRSIGGNEENGWRITARTVLDADNDGAIVGRPVVELPADG